MAVGVFFHPCVLRVSLRLRNQFVGNRTEFQTGLNQYFHTFILSYVTNECYIFYNNTVNNPKQWSGLFFECPVFCVELTYNHILIKHYLEVRDRREAVEHVLCRYFVCTGNFAMGIAFEVNP